MCASLAPTQPRLIGAALRRTAVAVAARARRDVRARDAPGATWPRPRRAAGRRGRAYAAVKAGSALTRPGWPADPWGPPVGLWSSWCGRIWVRLAFSSEFI
jgi:hypothetical protein